MREIKFRAWNGDMLSEPFAPWDLVDTGCDGLMTKSGVSVFWGGYPQNWMQFTGLLDKNGKEIYEGDLLQQKPELYEVVWDDTWGAFTLRLCGKGHQSLIWGRGNKMAIIGNIYSNPELLGAK